jgi:hypothetical protein
MGANGQNSGLKTYNSTIVCFKRKLEEHAGEINLSGRSRRPRNPNLIGKGAAIERLLGLRAAAVASCPPLRTQMKNSANKIEYDER